MSVRLRVICGQRQRVCVFERSVVSVGQGPFNDVVFADSNLARVHGELEKRDDGAVAFRTRASAEPTRIFRADRCTQRCDGLAEETFFVQAGDIIQMGQPPAVAIEVLEVESCADVQWRHHCCRDDQSGAVDPGDGPLFYRLVSAVAEHADMDYFLRAAALLLARAGCQVCQLDMAIPIETVPWRSQVHRLDDVNAAPDRGVASNPAKVAGTYRHSQDPMAPFDVDIRAVLPALQTLDGMVVIESGQSPEHILVPVGVDDTLAGVVDLGFDAEFDDALIDAVAGAVELIEPLAKMVVAAERRRRRLEGIVEENRYWRERQRRRYVFKDLIAESQPARQVYGDLDGYVGQDHPVLVRGEAGSGKALAARALHHLGERNDAMFTSINCAKLPGDMLDFELFGTVANALSGDVQPRTGVFELAVGGTVYLEEVDQLSLMLQGKLLRMLREGEVRRIGDAVGRGVDVRLLAGSHRDLRALVDRGRFRRDLYLALNDHALRLPALRERKADILPLARTFLGRFAKRYDRPCRRLSPAVADRLVNHRWRGNVRELKAVMEAAALNCETDEITADDLSL